MNITAVLYYVCLLFCIIFVLYKPHKHEKCFKFFKRFWNKISCCCCYSRIMLFITLSAAQYIRKKCEIKKLFILWAQFHLFRLIIYFYSIDEHIQNAIIISFNYQKKFHFFYVLNILFNFVRSQRKLFMAAYRSYCMPGFINLK